MNMVAQKAEDTTFKIHWFLESVRTLAVLSAKPSFATPKACKNSAEQIRSSAWKLHSTLKSYVSTLEETPQNQKDLEHYFYHFQCAYGELMKFGFEELDQDWRIQIAWRNVAQMFSKLEIHSVLSDSLSR